MIFPYAQDIPRLTGSVLPQKGGTWSGREVSHEQVGRRVGCRWLVIGAVAKDFDQRPVACRAPHVVPGKGISKRKGMTWDDNISQHLSALFWHLLVARQVALFGDLVWCYGVLLRNASPQAQPAMSTLQLVDFVGNFWQLEALQPGGTKVCNRNHPASGNQR